MTSKVSVLTDREPQRDIFAPLLQRKWPAGGAGGEPPGLFVRPEVHPPGSLKPHMGASELSNAVSGSLEDGLTRCKSGLVRKNELQNIEYAAIRPRCTVSANTARLGRICVSKRAEMPRAA